MRVVLACLPCYLKQVVNTLNEAGVAGETARQLVCDVLPLLPALDPAGTPAENSSLVLHRLYDLMGDQDPFRREKQDSNQRGIHLLPQLRSSIIKSPDPLFTACRVAVAGNIIDMGILPDYDLAASLQEAMTTEFAVNDYAAFRERLAAARRVLVIGDNSGEIAFDRLLVEQLGLLGVTVTYGVKGGPILNDATLADAVQVGMGEVAQLITNGNRFLGTVLARCAPDFREALAGADLVVSKGQANYESLESTPEAGEKTFFLLRAKCQVVADRLGVKLGAMVFWQNRPISFAQKIDPL